MAASWTRRLFGSKRRGAAAADGGRERTIYINANPPRPTHGPHTRHPQYPANQIRTAKYTVLSFVPKNLFEQFRRAANIYFLFLLILQFIPAVTTGMPGLSALALFTIVFLTMLKDGYEDSKRSASDKEANRARAVVLGQGWVNVNKPPAHMLRPRGLLRLVFSDSGAGGSVGGVHSGPPHGMPEAGGAAGDAHMDVDGSAWLATEWRHVHVGDIVLLRDGDAVPADLVLLAASGGDDSCFVETKNLDGETNLKTKAVVPLTAHLRSPAQLAAFACAIDAEPPSTQLYAFKGAIRRLGSPAPEEDGASAAGREPLGVDNLLLRGSVVRNTAWAVGAAVFTGDETKIMMNAGETPSKRSRIERMMNYQVLTQFCLLFVLCLLSAVLGGAYYGRGASFQALFVVGFQTHTNQSAPLYGFLTFWTSLILYQTVVPISLYVTIEVVKSFQAYFINQDIDMYYAPTDRRCVPKSWNLSDDLGQVEYVFSDKTGTLTQNVMVFRQCSVRGRVYGELASDEGDPSGAEAAGLRRAMDAKMAQFFDNPYRQGAAATFLDTAIYDDLQADGTQARAVIEFFTVLALCHTAVSHVPDASRPHVIEYKAQSPDEAALVATARDVGFAFVRRERTRLVCSFLGHEQAYEQLATLEFTSARKRMSVVVRRADGRIVLLCKGADSVVLARTKPGQERLKQATLDDLERFAARGLRTLCLGYRILDEAEYAAWRAAYDRAVASLGDREAEVERACDLLEQQLQLVGGTAIEDKLQDGVPDTIAQLALAGIKLWVLTGDKTETAINIGYSCNLLTPSMQPVVVAADGADATRAQLERALLDFADTHADLSYAGGGGGRLAGVAARKPGAWRRLLRRSAPASAPAPARDGLKDGLKDGLRDPAFDGARRVALDKSKRPGLRGVWDDVRTRNIPAERPAGPRLRRDVPLALVIDGAALKHALEPALAPLFLEVAVRCRSVLCCRVSPLQKALVVRLVKRHLGTLCLAVGDGANDVSMIQEADVGIGISGEEGLQAVMASDYAIGQFRFLQRLLLVHGRWSYLRIASMVLNFFYKNVVFTVSLFWFQIYCQWSVSNFFDYALVTLYNMLFTSLPPGALGVFDQDLPAFVGVVVPQLYKRGIYKLEYSMARFWTYIVDGLYQSAAVVFLVVYAYRFSGSAQRSGLDTSDKDDVGTVGAFCVVLVTNLYMGLNNRNWTWVMPVAQLFGLALLLGVFFIYGAMFDDVFSAGAGKRVFVQPSFWFLLALTAVVCLLPHYVVKFVRSAWYPTDTDVVHEIIKGFRSHQGSRAKHPSVAAAGPLDYAMSRAGKEVPFGAVPEHRRPLARRHRHPGAVHSHAMDGAIPLNDLGPYLHTAESSFRSTPALATDALTRPGMYQGTRYPEQDAALVQYLHGLAHMHDDVAASAEGEDGADGAASGAAGKLERSVRQDVAMQAELPDSNNNTLPPGRVSARSSMYNLDDGTLLPHTGYAFAHEERRQLRAGSKPRHIQKRR